jgi:hypothetical protein
MSLTWGGSAFATDHDVFNKLVAKVARTDSAGGHMQCAIPGFNPDASLGFLNFCNGDFVVIH